MADKRKASPEPQPAGALIKRQKNDDALVLKASTSSGAGGGALIRAVERTSGLQAPIMSLTGHGVCIISPSRRGTELLASVSDDSTVKIWDTRQKHAAETFTEKFPLCAVCWSEDGGIVFAGGIDNEIKAWDLRKKEVVFTLSGHMDTITGLRLSPDGSSLLSNAMDNTVRTWDVKPFAPTGSRLLKIFEGAPHGYEKNLLRPSWSPDGDFIAVGSGDRTVVIWDTATRKIAYKLPGHKGCVNEVDWHPREPIVVSCSNDKTLLLGEINPAEVKYT
ncbi:hypothetical protein HK102_007964 [Quaeritorhiza haematococci]|nr:hypothetical protein HK102_007964 [Quaeritorhiza haematococci]